MTLLFETLALHNYFLNKCLHASYSMKLESAKPCRKAQKPYLKKQQAKEQESYLQGKQTGKYGHCATCSSHWK